MGIVQPNHTHMHDGCVQPKLGQWGLGQHGGCRNHGLAFWGSAVGYEEKPPKKDQLLYVSRLEHVVLFLEGARVWEIVVVVVSVCAVRWTC